MMAVEFHLLCLNQECLLSLYGVKFSHFSLIFQIESNDAQLKAAEKARRDAEQRLEDSQSAEVSLREEYRSEVSVCFTGREPFCYCTFLYHGFFLGLCLLAECLCLGFDLGLCLYGIELPCYACIAVAPSN